MNKDNYYQEITEHINLITDRLGKHIDKGIKHTVVAMTMSGFHTTASCEGHITWGLPYPWIDVDDPKERIKLDALLKDFNLDRRFTENLYLKTVDFGRHGGCRMMHYQDITANGVKNKKLLGFLQGEMHAFGDYLLSLT